MNQVQLVTRDGEQVVAVAVPPFEPPADIISWGMRLFVHAGEGVYREGLCWVAQSERGGVTATEP